jgi:group I intron endonuclease
MKTPVLSKHTREEMRKTGVYEIVHTASGKRYIGSASVSFSSRLRCHRYDLKKQRHSSVLLQRAWNKYGANAFEFRILEFTLPQHAVAVEQTFIDWLKTYDPKNGFNILAVAGSSRGIKRSEETKQKVREATIRQFSNPETRERHAAGQRNRHRDESERELVSKHFKEFYSNPEVKEAMRERVRLHWADESTRIAHSANQKAVLSNPETRKKQSDSANKRWNNPKARDEQREKTRAIVGTPEARERARQKTIAINADPERKAKILEKNRATRAAKKLQKKEGGN